VRISFVTVVDQASGLWCEFCGGEHYSGGCGNLATPAEQSRISIWRNPHTSVSAASDCGDNRDYERTR